MMEKMISGSLKQLRFERKPDAVGDYLVRLWAAEQGESGEIYWVDVEIYACAGYDAQGLLWPAKEQGAHSTHNPDDAEVVVDGFFKWDGCTQLKMDVHVDDNDDLQRLFSAISLARREAAKIVIADKQGLSSEYTEGDTHV